MAHISPLRSRDDSSIDRLGPFASHGRSANVIITIGGGGGDGDGDGDGGGEHYKWIERTLGSRVSG